MILTGALISERLSIDFCMALCRCIEHKTVIDTKFEMEVAYMKNIFVDLMVRNRSVKFFIKAPKNTLQLVVH